MSRIGQANAVFQAKAVFQKINSILYNKPLHSNGIKSVLNCYIKHVVLYRSTRLGIKKILEVVKLSYLSRMLQIQRTPRLTNNNCLEKANESQTFYVTLRRESLRRKSLAHFTTIQDTSPGCGFKSHQCRIEKKKLS